mgnify:CR=1 FL=1
MFKKIMLVFTLLLVGCSAENVTDAEKSEEAATTSFILRAADGYVRHDNYKTPHTYVVDINRNEVYVDINEEPSGLTPEEIIENAENKPEEYTPPIFEINVLNVEEDFINLQYDSKNVDFTAISDSYYENQEGIRYIIESYSGINAYINSFNQ